MSEEHGGYHCSCGYTCRSPEAMDRHNDTSHPSEREDAIAADIRYQAARDELR